MILKMFVFGMKDLSKMLESIDKQRKVFISRVDELRIYPKSVNVIDYDKSEIIFHGTLEYNESL